MNQIINYLKTQSKEKKVLLYGDDIVIQDIIKKTGLYCRFAINKTENSGIHANDNEFDFFVVYNYLDKVPNFNYGNFFKEMTRIIKNDGSILIYNDKTSNNISSCFVETLFQNSHIENAYKEEDGNYFFFVSNYKEQPKSCSKKIVISPYSKGIGDNKKHPKNYPFWQEVINSLKNNGFSITQIGGNEEKLFDNIDESFLGKPLSQIKNILKSCDLWISVDNMVPHLANTINKKGIVIWAQSDPKLFGYAQNKNLLKDKKYLRDNQFATWFECTYIEEAFVEPNIVVDAVLNF